LQIRGLRLDAVGNNLELGLLAFVQGVDARLLKRGGVDEHVRSAGFRLDEAKALLRIVELNGTCLSHRTGLSHCMPAGMARDSEIWGTCSTQGSTRQSKFVSCRARFVPARAAWGTSAAWSRERPVRLGRSAAHRRDRAGCGAAERSCP